VAALVVRFRRARGVERQQLKWLLYAVSLSPLLFLELPVVGDVLFPLVLIGIPTAVGVAILRYRLYDIDVIIRRTLQYTLVTAVLALVYAGSVVLLQSIYTVITGGRSPIVVVMSTLFIAALFSPLRRGVQSMIDRRFFRKKYDAQQVLAHFAQTARDEVSLEALTAELVRVVQETMQPASTSIWLATYRQEIKQS
jgi:hypothetical protein